jgi:hypothetical protein
MGFIKLNSHGRFTMKLAKDCWDMVVAVVGSTQWGAVCQALLPRTVVVAGVVSAKMNRWPA